MLYYICNEVIYVMYFSRLPINGMVVRV